MKKKIKRKYHYGFIGLCLCLSHSAFAFKCGQYVIAPGMYQNEVLKKCGEADSVEVRVEHRGTEQSQQAPHLQGRHSQHRYHEQDLPSASVHGQPAPKNRRYYANPYVHPRAINLNPKTSLAYGVRQFTQEEIKIEEWIYNFGVSRFQYYLRFENGKLIRIRPLERGY